MMVLMMSMWSCTHILLPQDGWTPLIFASANGILDALKALLAAGADKDVRDEVWDRGAGRVLCWLLDLTRRPGMRYGRGRRGGAMLAAGSDKDARDEVWEGGKQGGGRKLGKRVFSGVIMCMIVIMIFMQACAL